MTASVCPSTAAPTRALSSWRSERRKKRYGFVETLRSASSKSNAAVNAGTTSKTTGSCSSSNSTSLMAMMKRPLPRPNWRKVLPEAITNQRPQGHSEVDESQSAAKGKRQVQVGSGGVKMVSNRRSKNAATTTAMSEAVCRLDILLRRASVPKNLSMAQPNIPDATENVQRKLGGGPAVPL